MVNLIERFKELEPIKGNIDLAIVNILLANY